MNIMMKKTFPKKNLILTSLLVVLVVILGMVIFNRLSPNTIHIDLSKPSEESFEAPGRNWQSEKKVEDYFVEHLRMTPQEAQEIRSKPGVDGKVMLRIREHTTLEGLLGNLEYYGFVKDKEALRYALEHSKDTVPGKANALKAGENTIDAWSYYRISEDMTAWEIADELLSHPTYFSFDEYNYTFMP